MNTKHLLMEPDQFEEQLIDDPAPIENEIELVQCNIQTEEIMHLSITGKETLGAGTTDNHKCTVCNKELLSAYTLANHMRSHTGERPFGCRVCEKFFKTKSNLNEHYRLVFFMLFCFVFFFIFMVMTLLSIDNHNGII